VRLSDLALRIWKYVVGVGGGHYFRHCQEALRRAGVSFELDGASFPGMD
jgi:D-tyrosyl-tRNA(Tyr) deacylase